MRRSLFQYTILMIFLLCGFIVGASALYWFHVTTDTNSFKAKHRVFEQATSYIRHLYVDTGPLTPETVYYGAIEGAVKRLDDRHSSFLSPDQYSEMKSDIEQQYGGIGAYVEPAESAVEIVAPIRGTPAFEAGLKPGDLVIAIDGKPVESEQTLDKSISMMKGEPGTDVTITIRRANRTFDTTLTRRNIQTRSVRSTVFDGDITIGYLSIERFAGRTAREVGHQLNKLKKRGMDALMVDLRNNPGGTLDEAQQTVDYWLDRGKIVSIKGRYADQNETYRASGAPSEPDYPIAVLINKGSASGSEIVAGALKDHGRAIIMGETTFGKGSVQSVLPLADGSALKLTTAHYHTPSGRVIKKGIEPHFPIKQDEVDTATVKQIRELLSGDTITQFVQKHPRPESGDIDRFIKTLQDSGYSLERRYVRQQIRREQLAREGRQLVTHLPTDRQLKRALDKFRTLIEQANDPDKSLPDRAIPDLTND